MFFDLASNPGLREARTMSEEGNRVWLKEAQQRMKKGRHCPILAGGEETLARALS